MTRQTGYIAVVLHAHLPLILHADKKGASHELPFYEWCADVLLPLLDMLERLDADNVAGPLTLSLSSTLGAMLDNPDLKKRLDRYLARRLQICQRECKRTAKRPALSSVAEWHRNRLESLADAFNNKYSRDLCGVLKALRESNRLELITAVGSHPIVPLLARPEVLRAQIRAAVDDFSRRFGAPPAGMWLPECAYQPGIEERFATHGVRYTIVASSALEGADPSPILGLSRPLAGESGLAFFARNEQAAREITNAETGFRSDPTFLDRRLSTGLDTVDGELRGLASSSRWRINGLEYFGFPDENGLRQTYDPGVAEAHARQRAQAFVNARHRQLSAQQLPSQAPPVTVLATDSQLFGRWWLEGPAFLEALVRQTADSSTDLTTPTRYLDACRLLQISRPAASSWGRQGFLETWLDEDNAWLHHRLHNTEERLLNAVEATTDPLEPTISEALSQATRELFLAQTSDWFALIGQSRDTRYALERIEDHLAAANLILSAIGSGKLDDDLVRKRYRRWPIFTKIDLATFHPD